MLGWQLRSGRTRDWWMLGCEPASLHVGQVNAVGETVEVVRCLTVAECGIEESDEMTVCVCMWNVM